MTTANKPIFSGRLYVEGLRQLLTMAMIMMGVCAAFTIWIQGAGAIGSAAYFAGHPYAVAPALLAYIYLGPVLLAYKAYAFLFGRASSDAYHALPHSRLCLYLSIAAAAATYVLGTIFAVCVSGYLTRAYCAAVGMFYGYGFDCAVPTVAQTWAGIGWSFLSFGSAALMVMACVILAISLTGTRFSALMAFGAIWLAPRAISLGCALHMGDISGWLLLPFTLGPLFNSGLNLSVSLLLGPIASGSLAPVYDTIYYSVPAILYTFGFALVYMALGALAFIKRPSETAERPTISAMWRHVLRGYLMLPVAVAIIISAYHNQNFRVSGYTLLFTAVAVFACLLFELINTRSAKSLLAALCSLPVVAAIAFALFVGADAYAKAQIALAPSAQEIASVRESDKQQNNYPNYDAMLRAEAELADSRVISLIAGALANDAAHRSASLNGVGADMGDTQAFVFDITLSNGRVITRQIRLTSAEARAYYSLAAQDAAYASAAHALPDDGALIRLTINDVPPEQAMAVWQAYRREYAGNYHVINRLPDDALVLDHRITLSGVKGHRVFMDNYAITEYTPEAMRLFISAVNEGFGNAKDELRDIILGGAAVDYGMDIVCHNMGGDGISDMFRLSFRDGELVHIQSSMVDDMGNVYGSYTMVTRDDMPRAMEAAQYVLDGDTAGVDITRPFIEFEIWAHGEQGVGRRAAGFAAVGDEAVQFLIDAYISQTN